MDRNPSFQKAQNKTDASSFSFFLSFLLINVLVGQESFCGTDFHIMNTSNCGGCECYSSVVNDISEVETYYIPLVFHKVISEESAPENISDEVIESAVSVLNEQFKVINGNVVSPKIEFLLARIDENGLCTNGITTTESDLTFNVVFPQMDNIEPEPIKHETKFWDPSRYLNIWVVNSVNSATGYSSMPFIFPNNQGIVIQYEGLELVIAHEISHFLGLFHASGCSVKCSDNCGMNNEDSAELGDLVADTAPAIRVFGVSGGTVENCFNALNTCTNLPADHPEGKMSCSGDHSVVNFPHINRMSESYNCWDRFSEGQFSRMFHFLNRDLRRLWYPGYIIKKEMILDEPTNFHRDVNIYAGGRLVINSEVIMAEGTSITVHDGGQLIVDGGHIRGCDISEEERGKWDGIRITGRNMDGYDVEFSTSTIEDVEGFVVTAAHSGFFALEAPGKIKSINTKFNNVDGLLRTLSRIPSGNHSLIEDCEQNGGQYGLKIFNGLDIEVRRNKFFDITKECVSSVGGSFIIQGNEFHADETDVALTTILRGAPSIIDEGNVFRGKRYGIRAAGATSSNHTISGNIFFGRVASTDNSSSPVDRDIYMDGITDYTITDNKFFGVTGVSSRATVNTSEPDNGNQVSGNEFIENTIGIYPHASNPNYFFSNNCFGTRRIDARIEGAMADQGQEGGNPPNNCFTNQGVPNSGFTVIDIGGSPEVFDYVEPITEGVDCRHALLAPSVGVNILDTNIDPGNRCNGRVEEPVFNENNNISLALYEQLDNIAVLISQGDIEQAIKELNSIDQNHDEGVDAHFVASQTIEAFEDYELVQNRPSIVQQLKTIAMKGHPSSGYAQALHYFVTGNFVDNLDLSFIEDGDLGERSRNSEGTSKVKKDMDIFPNPASSMIYISSPEQTKNIRIYNAVGRIVYDGVAPSQIDVSLWDDGIYFIKLTKGNNEIKTEKIIVNK